MVLSAKKRSGKSYIDEEHNIEKEEKCYRANDKTF